MSIVNEQEIEELLATTRPPDSKEIRDILDKALTLSGLDLRETAKLLMVEKEENLREIFHCAHQVKEAIYGKRLVFFAPLYLSNLCTNNCLYCAFRRDNRELQRKVLDMEEIEEEVRILENQGHKRLLIVVGESPRTSIDYLEKAIERIYSIRNGKGEIRRINVNAPAMSVEDFRRLRATRIGTYQLFQETYHRKTYEWVHPRGPKADYEWHLTAMDRAQQAGIDDVGLGVLFGLYDYRFEVLALLQHANHLDRTYGTGPHTISVPRIEPAQNAPLSTQVPYPVSDRDFKKLVAILRLSVPYTGMILSTRERPELRHQVFGLGISQISAGSRTSPGAYKQGRPGDIPQSSQFSLGDHRPLDVVIREICKEGYIPSFCTACYRLGRTGPDFMELAKPGLIQRFCSPNAILTFMEYLEDYASPETKRIGLKALWQHVEDIPDPLIREKTRHRLQRIQTGERDLYF